MFFGIWMACVGEPPPSKAEQPATVDVTEILVGPLDVRIELTRPPDEPDVEAHAFALLELEHILAQFEGVVPRLGDLEPPPGATHSSAPSAKAMVTVESWTPLRTLYCSSGCEVLEAESIDAWALEVQKRIDRPLVADGFNPPSDPYIRKMVGRAAAAWMELPDAPPRPRALEKAIRLDASLVATQWLAARSPGVPVAQRVGLLRRAAADRGTALAVAGEAAGLEDVENLKASSAMWQRAASMAPRDVRFVFQAARAALLSGEPTTAEHYLKRLDPEDPAVLALRVQYADAIGGDADESLLIEWQRASPSNPEPVRRRIQLHLTTGSLSRAGALSAELARRGAEEEADALAFAVAFNTGKTRDANRIAKRRGWPQRGPTLEDVEKQWEKLDEELGVTGDVARTLANGQNTWQQARPRQCRERESAEIRRLGHLGATLRSRLDGPDEGLLALKKDLRNRTVAPLLDARWPARLLAYSKRTDGLMAQYLHAVVVQDTLLKKSPCG